MAMAKLLNCYYSCVHARHTSLLTFFFIFLAGLDGRTSSEKAKVDLISETMRECIAPITEIFNEANENTRVSARESELQLNNSWL